MPTKQIRVYADGVFDLFHYGHAKVLEQAKKAFPNVYLMVGVNTQEDTLKHKGITVMTYEERCECVKHSRWVDEVIYDAPWVITKEFMEKYNIDYVAHDGDPYPSHDTEDIYMVPKMEGKFISTKRTEGISTTDLIERILKNIEQYQDRNDHRTQNLFISAFKIHNNVRYPSER